MFYIHQQHCHVDQEKLIKNHDIIIDDYQGQLGTYDLNGTIVDQ